MPLAIGQQQILGGNCLFYNGGIANPNYYQVQLIVTLNSQSIANNTSNITETLQVRSVNSGYWTWDNQTPTIQGVALAQAGFDTRATNVWQTFGSRTFDVGHNSDGSLTLGASASFVTTSTASPYSLRSGSVSGSVDIVTIPRAALLNTFVDFLIDVTAGAINGNLTIYSAGFSHFVQLFKNGVERANWTIAAGPVGSYNYALALSAVQRNAIFGDMPISFSDVFTLVVSTFNGGTQIGSSQSRTATGTIPAGYKPTITTTNSNFSWLNKNDPPALRGYLIQNVSTLTLLLSGGSAPTGASLSMYQVRFGTVTRQGTYTGAAISENVGLITGSGTLYAYYSVKDARGRWSDEISETLTVQAYNPPINNGFKVQRNVATATSADYILKFSNSLYSIGNTWNYIPYYWTGSYWQAGKAATAIVAVSIDTIYTHALPYSESLVYNLKVVLTDLFNSVEYTDVLPTSAFPLSFGKKGCGFGKDTSDAYNVEVGALGISSDGPIIGPNGVMVSQKPISYTNLNTVIKSGLYRCDACTEVPAGASDGSQLLVVCGGGDTISQTYYDWYTGKNYIRNGTIVAGTSISSAGWKEIVTYESGSNANGRYIKWSDGTLECWGNVACSEVANVFASRTWTYPYPNYAGILVNATVVINLVSATWGFSVPLLAIELSTDTYATIKIKTDYTQVYYIGCRMIGRWKA